MPLVSGPTTPCPIDVDTETFSTSVLKQNLGEQFVDFSTYCHHRFGQHSIEHMLLQPRSAPETVLDCAWFTPKLRRTVPCPSARYAQLLLRTLRISGVRSEAKALAPSIFGAVHFDRWVVTHSIAGSNLHGHRPILQSKRRPSEVLWMSMKPFGLLTHALGFLRIASTAYQ